MAASELLVPPAILYDRPHTSGTGPMFIASCAGWVNERSAVGNEVCFQVMQAPSLRMEVRVTENAKPVTEGRFRIIECHVGLP